MQARYIHDGNAIDYYPTSDVAAGQIVPFGDLIGIAKLDIKANSLGALAVTGVYDVVKRKIAAAKKEYDTAFTKAQNTQTQQSLATSSQTANQTLAAAIADRDQKQANLNQAQFFGDSDRMEQAQSEYDESDYAVRQAEYQKALSDAQNSAYEMSEAQKNYKDALKSGTPEEKRVAKERLNEAKENRNDAFAALSGLQPQETRQLLSDVSRDYSSEDEAKPERTTTTKGTFSAFESLGQSFDWQRSNGEKQLDELTKIRENLENQDDGYI